MSLTTKMKNMFRRRTPVEMAARQITDTQIELLNALAMQEAVSAQVTCYTDRIARLRSYIQKETSEVRD